MGWSNPDVPWSELEAALSGRHRLESVGRRRGRRGRLAGLVAQARAVPAPPTLLRPPLARASRTPSCTATPTSASWTVRVTRRSWSSRRRAWAWTRWHSPTTTACTAWSGSPRPPPSSGSARSSARSCRWGSPPRRTGWPIPRAATCSCSRATPTGTGGCAARSAPPSSPARRRAARSTTSRRSSPTRPGTCSCSPAAARARCARRWAAVGAPPRLSRSVAWSSGSARTTSPSSSPTRRCPRTSRSTTPWPASPPTRGCRPSPPPPRTTPRRSGSRWPRRWRRSGPGAAWTRPTAGCRPRAPRTCARARRWPPGSTPAIPARWRGRRGSARSARSRSISSLRTCPRSRPRPASRRRSGCASSPAAESCSATAATPSTPRPSPPWSGSWRSSRTGSSPATS